MPLDYQQLLGELVRAWERGDPRLMAAVLAFGSAVLYAMACNLAVSYRILFPVRISNEIQRIAVMPAGRVVYHLLLLAYYLGIPFLALLFGWLDLRALGLTLLDWADGVRWAIVLALACWSLLMFVWVPYLRATPGVRGVGRGELQHWARRIVQVVYMQAHWAYYRATAILILLSIADDDRALYWGACTGLVLVAAEAWSDPRVRRGVARVGRGEQALWNAGQVVINTVGFVLTRNAWILILLHLALEFTVPHLRPAAPPAAVPAPAARPAATPSRNAPGA